MTSKEMIGVVVTVDDAHRSGIEDVARALATAGLRGGTVLAMAGIVTGKAPATKLAALANVEGVVAVERDGQMQAL